MHFRVLGPLQVSRGGAVVRIGSRMQRRLLALLLIHAGRPVSADRVIDVLWSGAPPPSAPKALHAYVSRLRGTLGDTVEVASDVLGYRLSIDDHELDAHRFERLVERAQEHLADEPAVAAALLGEALALWRGEAYGEFAHEEFARPEAVRLDELRWTATEDAFSARLADGDAELIGDVAAFVVVHPLRERPHAQLMTALSQVGRQNEALEVYDRLRRSLVDELGLEPSPALQQLQVDILQQAPDVAPSAADARQQAAGLAAPGNLPEPTTSLIGRRRETEAVAGVLERARLVTLTGVGGVGKTRLALRVAAGIAERYPEGVWWCELAPADDDAVGHTVAGALGVQQQARDSVTDSIIESVADRELLVVLDNCEHVADACAHLAERLLRRCPRATILATSREPLGLEGEQVWPVPPLPLPSGPGDKDAPEPSEQLFYDRAAMHRADFTVDAVDRGAVAAICRRLDGVPLAIELAAALVPALEPPEIADRLAQRFGLLTHGSRTDPRHRSLAAVVEWSYQLLDDAERHLFDRLAVFAGGFTLDAIEGICADERIPRERIAALLTGLVNRSVVGVDRSAASTRYHLLETLRHYAAERLDERGEDAVLRSRHAAWFLDFAERADVGVRGRDEARAVEQLETELANLRAAHRWLVEQHDAERALRLAAALYVFATWRLHDEVFDWAERAAERPAALGHRLHPTVLGVVARGLSTRGELTRARELAEQALAFAPDASDPRRLVALDSLEAVALYEGRLTDCRDLARRALESAQHHGDAYNSTQAQIHATLALVYDQQRDAGLTAALELHTAADRLGNPHHRAWARYVLAEAYGDDDPDRALGLLGEALDLAQPVHDRFLQGVAHVAITTLLARHHSPREALGAFPGVIHHWHRVGDWTHQWTTLRNLVPLLVHLGADEPAARLYGAEQAGHTGTYGADADRLAQAAETLATGLGDDRFEALVAEGARLSGAEAIDLALTTIADTLDG